MLAAVGCAAVEVWRRRVAIISTGGESRAEQPIGPAIYIRTRRPRRRGRGGRRRSKPLGIGPDDEIVLSVSSMRAWRRAIW